MPYVVRQVRVLMFLVFALVTTIVSAQNSYTSRLETTENGEGRVTISADQSIRQIIDGTKKVKTEAISSKKSQTETIVQKSQDINSVMPIVDKPITSREDRRTYVSGNRYKAQGYRIQVYTGGNQRADKQQAQTIANKVHNLFPELSVYTHFDSPRWICRVGDFRNREDAERYVRKIRQAGISREARTVKCTVLLR